MISHALDSLHQEGALDEGKKQAVEKLGVIQRIVSPVEVGALSSDDLKNVGLHKAGAPASELGDFLTLAHHTVEVKEDGAYGRELVQTVEGVDGIQQIGTISLAIHHQGDSYTADKLLHFSQESNEASDAGIERDGVFNDPAIFVQLAIVDRELVGIGAAVRVYAAAGINVAIEDSP